MKARVLALLVLSSATANAQGMRDVPIGARTATMGGTGVAAGIDSAMPFLNPAGIAGMPSDTLSVSATAYSFIIASPDNYFHPNGFAPRFGITEVVEEDASIRQIAALPTGIAYFAHFGDEKAKLAHTLGLSISLPIYQDRETDASLAAEGSGGRLTSQQILVDKLRMLFFGPSYGIRIGDSLRIGVSILAYWADATSDDHLLASRAPGLGPSFRNIRTQTSATSFGLTGIIGAQLQVKKELWAGLAFETRGIPFVGGGDYTQVADGAGVDPGTGQQQAARASSRGDVDFYISRPWRISAGVAWEKPNKYALAADLHFHPPIPDLLAGEGTLSGVAITTGQPPTFVNIPFKGEAGTRFIVNPSIGGEIQPFEKVAFRGGLFTDFDAPDATSHRLDWYGVTFGVGHKTDPLGATYGLIYRYGRGVIRRTDDLGPVDTATAEIDYTAHGLMVVLSATLELGGDALIGKLRRSPFRTF